MINKKIFIERRRVWNEKWCKIMVDRRGIVELYEYIKDYLV